MDNFSVVAGIIIDAIAKENKALDWSQAFSSQLKQLSLSPGDVFDSDSLFQLIFNISK
jgi:hypothetical protein